jgi:hypothetical protein
MIQWLKGPDEALRGPKADPRLPAGGTAHIHIKPLVSIAIMLGIVYGQSIGPYAALTRTPLRCPRVRGESWRNARSFTVTRSFR